ncbi:bifunctional [glutamine synthetase] adenylyltransferase/[glutamine synthetase]-adenylyl-L-tyrosine phosphorylase [Amaricoccus sp. W119]|uniref:bifunctional [glutamine synthetase] adenylyltransferase/[glutamine synthetase]-adenylyl-L-tyrosine phosphorylase n=1 Tax=Amaricoccus sp. W119 TaxID=3391833 RepID=UPI0039A57E97
MISEPLASSIVTAPRPHDRDRAREIAEIFADVPETPRELLVGTAGCSGFLDGLMRREADWLRGALGQPPGRTMKEVLAAMDAEDGGPLGARLRIAKRRVALLAGLADLGGVWPVLTVTQALTDLADRAVALGLRDLVAEEVARGKLKVDLAEVGETAGMFALAMGKMGAGELNYSSDIDLVMMFDESRYDPDDYADVRKVFIRVTQRLVKLLSEATVEGYVFRVDLRLRPDPSVTPVCIATDPAENYYESVGRTWERAAFIKARPCAGAIEAGWDFLERLRPFIWRRHLDFAAIEDAHDMRLRIREHKKLTGPLELLGHDVKLGQGGIREIEFFTQTRQLITGGRDPDLRQRDTLGAMEALTAKGWVEPATAAILSDAYLAHRALEHRLQMLEDQQTHRMPTTREGLARLMDFCAADPKRFEKELLDRFRTVHELTEPFFSHGAEAPEAPPEVEFADPEAAEKVMQGWTSLPALRSERAREIFRRLLPRILGQIAKSASPDQALNLFDGFLRVQPAGVQLFSLMEANPKVLDLIVDICGSTPELARSLGQNAGVLDAVLSRDFYRPLRGAADLRHELAGKLAEIDDYETALNLARVWTKERRFRIGVHLLRGIASPEEAGDAYSAVAEAVLAALGPLVAHDFAKRHGPPPGAGAVIVALGKLGSREMTASSDLDLIVIYDAEGVESSEGRRPLPVSTYYARMTQAIISALSAPMAEGILYEVDMRLRPSGRQGPLATSISSFATYQEKEAWTWEHLALTRARVVAGPHLLAGRVSEAIDAVMARAHDPEKVLADVRDMRRRLAEAKEAAAANPWEVKLGPGRLMDIELLAQAGALINGLAHLHRPRRMLSRLARVGWLTGPEADTLEGAHAALTATQQILRLASDRTRDPAEMGQGLVDLLLAATDQPDLDSLRESLSISAEAADAIIRRKLGGEAEERPDAAASKAGE